MPKSSVPALLLITVRFRTPLSHECLNQIFRNATQTEAADHDGGAILNVGDCLLKIGNDFIHASARCERSNWIRQKVLCFSGWVVRSFRALLDKR